MKFLFDQNLSPRLVARFARLFPGSTHVETVGLGTALDQVVWEYARQNEFLIVTKDVDYGDMGLLYGFPPKVIWIRRGNCSTKEIEILIQNNLDLITTLNQDSDIGILMLF